MCIALENLAAQLIPCVKEIRAFLEGIFLFDESSQVWMLARHDDKVIFMTSAAGKRSSSEEVRILFGTRPSLEKPAKLDPAVRFRLVIE